MNSDLNIIMVPTTKCNLSCRHCFEERSDRVMSPAELQVVVQQVYEYSDKHNIDKIVFYWQGGEVLTLGPSWFEKMDETVSQVFSGSTIRVRHRLQSNLISYTTKWKPVIEKVFQNSIGSSLDYPSLYRGFPTIKGDQFNDIWLKYCDRARADGIDVSVISVLNKASLEMPPKDFLEFYSSRMGISNMQLNFPFDLYSHVDTRKSYFLIPSELGKFLVDLFDTWIDECSAWYRRIHINPFCELIDVFSFAPRPSRCNCIWSGSCADSFFSIGPDSSVGLCDCWVTSLPEFSFGNLQTQTLDEISRSPVRNRLGQRIESIIDSECADCPFLSICFGGCIIRTYGRFGTIESKDPYCEAYKALFSRVQKYVRSVKITGEIHEKTKRSA
ncbi:MAG: radical SAM protein [Desulfosarcina sp.]|nr:radical SAM protein [Desulfosarcina sp.]